MFKNYTYEGCTFECRLKSAFEAVGCIPWDYPIPPYLEEEGGNQIKMCTSSTEQKEGTSESNLAKFEDYMNSANSTNNCDCLSDCEEESFKIQVLSHVYFIKSIFKHQKSKRECMYEMLSRWTPGA